MAARTPSTDSRAESWWAFPALALYGPWFFLPSFGFVTAGVIAFLLIQIAIARPLASARVHYIRSSGVLRLSPEAWTYFERHAAYFIVPKVVRALASFGRTAAAASITLALLFLVTDRVFEAVGAVLMAVCLPPLAHLDHPCTVPGRSRWGLMHRRTPEEHGERLLVDAITSELHADPQFDLVQGRRFTG